MSTKSALEKRIQELEDEVKALKQRLGKLESMGTTPIMIPGWEPLPHHHWDYLARATLQ